MPVGCSRHLIVGRQSQRPFQVRGKFVPLPGVCIPVVLENETELDPYLRAQLRTWMTAVKASDLEILPKLQTFQILAFLLSLCSII